MRSAQIIAASRLHFGLLTPGGGHSRQFGGVGVMIENPNLRLSVEPWRQFAAEGPAADRVREFAQRWSSSRGLSSPPDCRFVIESLPRMHAGLGVGTQLALSVARLLCELTGESPPSPVDLALSVGRGERSAVGTYGFYYGGLIAESGKSAEERIAPLELQIALPDDWRWVLVCPNEGAGLHGSQEQNAFSELQQPTGDSFAMLSAEMQERLIPAARRGDFVAFSNSLYHFGYQSGLSFASIQGGAYNGPRLQQIVEAIQSFGISGVGQSSWGPTIFALCKDESAARELTGQLSSVVPDAETTITATANHGAQLSP